MHSNKAFSSRIVPPHKRSNSLTIRKVFMVVSQCNSGESLGKRSLLLEQCPFSLSRVLAVWEPEPGPRSRRILSDQTSTQQDASIRKNSLPHFPYLALDGIPKGATARPYQATAVPTGGFGRQDRNDATASLNVIGMTASEF